MEQKTVLGGLVSLGQHSPASAFEISNIIHAVH